MHSQHKGSIATSITSPAVDDEKTKPDHWLGKLGSQCFVFASVFRHCWWARMRVHLVQDVAEPKRLNARVLVTSTTLLMYSFTFRSAFTHLTVCFHEKLPSI